MIQEPDKRESPKQIKIGKEARDAMIAGVNKLVDVVKLTLGPKGQTIIFDEWPSPIATKDGVTVAQRIHLEERYESMGARIIQGVARRADQHSGDGTTTACVLAQALLHYGNKALDENPGLSPMVLKNGIDAAVKKITEELDKRSTILTTPEQLHQVALISANGDEGIAKIVTDARVATGNDGLISLDFGEIEGIELTLSEGFILQSGLTSPDFINDPQGGKCVFEDALIFVANNNFTAGETLDAVLKYATLTTQKPLVLFANDVAGFALQHALYNIKRGMKFAFVRLPGDGADRRRVMNDIAMLTGCVTSSSEEGKFLKEGSVTPDLYGTAQMITIDREKTVIIGGGGDKEAIKTYCDNLLAEKKGLESEPNPNHRIIESIRKRHANFNNAIASIIVGGKTELEARERMDRVQDATFATGAARDEGFLPGGGVALYKAVSALSYTNDMDMCESRAFCVVRDAIEQPLLQIMRNAGIEPTDEQDPDVPHIIRRGYNTEDYPYSYGFDAKDMVNCDLVEKGIIDSTRVVKCALEDAASIVGQILSSGAAICAIPDMLVAIKTRE